MLQRYLLRRAWGVPYATWSVAIFLTNFGAPFEALLGLSVVERIAVSTLASGAALAITSMKAGQAAMWAYWQASAKQ